MQHLRRSFPLIVAVFFLSHSAARPIDAADPPALRWGADAEGGAPYIFKDPANPQKNIGLEVDLAAAIAKELGRPIEFKQYNYDSLTSGLRRGDIDFAMNGIEVTPDRQALFRLSRPYYTYRLQLVVRANEKRFDSFETCQRAGVVVGTLGDTTSSRLLDERGIKSKVYDGQAEPYQDLALGRIDAVLLDEPIAVYYARPNPLLKFAGEAFREGHYVIAFRKDQEELASQVDAALDRLEQQGELARIKARWENPVGDVLASTGAQLSFAKYFPMLVSAARVTVEVSVLSMALAMLVGLLVAMCRLYGPAPVRWGAIAYVEFFRGIPVLLLLYLLYYGLPTLVAHANLGFQFKPSDLTVAVLAFGLNYAAYEAEIYRAGIAAIPSGQWEAAASLGMSPPLTFRRIILPQALRMIIAAGHQRLHRALQGHQPR